ncbi:hypothetical protein SGLAM104S_04435 [Streptomyces glaucescens]
MGAGHAHRLYRRGDSPVHALPPHTKLAAVFAFVLVVVSTPREAMWAFGVYALLLAVVAHHARVPAGFLLKRLLIEVPFVAFAVLMPFVAEGERVEALGLSLSVSGLWGAWNVLAKGTLGVAASVLLAATTELRELLLGLQRLKLPPLLVQIASFMIRYGDLIDPHEMRRMRIGAGVPRVRGARGVAAGAGACCAGRRSRPVGSSPHDDRSVLVAGTGRAEELRERAACVPGALLTATGLGAADLARLREELWHLAHRAEEAAARTR